MDYTKRSDSTEEAALIIGLGGTGTDAVIRLKRRIYGQLNLGEKDERTPESFNVKYLIIDSNSSKIKDQWRTAAAIDEKEEFFFIRGNDKIRNLCNEEYIKSRQEFYWLNYGYFSYDGNDRRWWSNNGIRQLGRYLLVSSAERIYEKIKADIQSLLKENRNRDLTVHICTGLSGATGSGIFLDVCYLVRLALQEMKKEDAVVCGYFFMPDVNISMPEIKMSSLLTEYIKVNGYTALQELDYCMNFSNNMDSFRMDYGFKKIDFGMKPVDLCWLVSATDASGKLLKDGYMHAISSVCSFIDRFLMKTRNTDRECVKEDEIWSLQKLMTVLNAADAEVELRHGANINYRIFGIDEEPLLWKNPLYTQTITKYNMKAIAREAADGCEMMGCSSIVHIYSGVSLHAYQELWDWERAYESDRKPCRHLYERGSENWNLKLPSPIPASFRGDKT